MLLKEDIVEGVYLTQIRERYGIPAGLIGVVHQVGTDWTGEWMFQLRFLDRPGRTRSVQWSLNLREKDLVDFELIGTWLTAQALLASLPSGKSKKAPKIPARLSASFPVRHPVWRRKWHPNQLQLFEDL